MVNMVNNLVDYKHSQWFTMFDHGPQSLVYHEIMVLNHGLTMVNDGYT